MQDRPKGHVLDENVDEHDQTKPLKDLSDLTENFPHLFIIRRATKKHLVYQDNAALYHPYCFKTICLGNRAANAF